ncbi:ScbA/BarX family gamma-butyrolactone biosynthesis protein [Streptomyces sp. NPDC087300]|uniref:ScbA/BarX family gamma-butyrolactone biosynthesis protein n=1 Tax=Streptomyces sp. NPDC087300 TaxID=3365780 RepID=UPI0037F44714
MPLFAGPVPSQPTLTTTVAREYVHRAAHSEVFLTGWRDTGEDTFTVTAQWPRSHSFFVSEHALYDPLLLCETIRQSLPLLSHAAYGVPFGHQLSWSHFQYELNPQAMRIEQAPADIQLNVTCRDIVYRRGVPTSLSMHFEILRGDLLLGSASTVFICVAPAIYRRMRAEHGDVEAVFGSAPAPSPALPTQVCGRDRVQDVVLSPSPTPQVPGRRWQLRVDTTHPVLFDHPVDHAPGMLLMEAIRQAAHALTPAADITALSSMDITFHHYVEFDSPCWVDARPMPSAEPGEPRGILVEVAQNDRTMLTAVTGVTDLLSPQLIAGQLTDGVGAEVVGAAVAAAAR